MPFYTPAESEGKELFDGIVARIYWGENIMTMVADLAPNAKLPTHSHPHEQGGIILEGELEFTIGDETKLLKPGDVYIVPGDAPHSAVAGNAPCKVLDIFSPPREDYK